MSDDGYRFPVDLTTIMLFASALVETNRAYYDEDYARANDLGGVIPPPTFPIAGTHWELGRGTGKSRSAPRQNALGYGSYPLTSALQEFRTVRDARRDLSIHQAIKDGSARPPVGFRSGSDARRWHA